MNSIDAVWLENKEISPNVISLSSHRFSKALEKALDDMPKRVMLRKLKNIQKEKDALALQLIGEAYRFKDQRNTEPVDLIKEVPKELYELLQLILSDFDYPNQETSSTGIACKRLASVICQLMEQWEAPNE